jgi:Vacuolar protein sorting-associated protein 62
VQALAVAVNSGLVDYPVGFSKMWGCEGLTIWQPKAPANYAALGCLITTDGKPPPLSSVVCVHRQVKRSKSHLCDVPGTRLCVRVCKCLSISRRYNCVSGL